MPSVELTDDQVVELVKQLPPNRKRAAILALAGGADARNDRMRLAESRLRRLAQDRGLNWDALSDEQRQAIIDDLVHEDRR
jgi:hypothetical protein